MTSCYVEARKLNTLGMEVEFALRVRVNGFREAKVSDWSSHAAQRIQQKQQEEQVKNERALQEDRLLETNSRRLWDELRNTLIQMCGEFNAEAGMRDTFTWSREDPLELRIEDSKQHKNISLAFDSRRHTVSTRGASPTKDFFSISVLKGTREVSFVNVSQSPVAVHEIAQKVLNDLLGI